MNPPPQSAKRKRSPSENPQPRPAPVVPSSPAQPNHVQINYLARRYSEDLPLVTGEDNLPTILSMIDSYEGVLQRHESMAANLGAKPKGQSLLGRFERMFDGPVKVIQSNARDGPAVTWLDVVEFSKNRPEEFTLNQVRNGIRLCHIWVKSCKVEVMEDDYDVIKYNPNPIPPQPIEEDERKELGTLEILDKRLQNVIALADAVSGRARQLNRRLRGRKSAMTGKRTTGPPANSESLGRSSGVNGGNTANPPSHGDGGTGESSNRDFNRSSHSPKSGFVAVNSRQAPQTNGEHYELGKAVTDLGKTVSLQASENHPTSIGSGGETPLNGVSAETHADLLRKFSTSKQRNSAAGQAERLSDSPRPPSSAAQASTGLNSSSGGGSKGRKHSGSEAVGNVVVGGSSSTVPISGSPSGPIPHNGNNGTNNHNSNNHHHHHHHHSPPIHNNHSNNNSKSSSNSNKPLPTPAEDGGPYKARMLNRVEQLSRGERIEPPCDRCRRLRIECSKNLTACMGCTKKHAKCSWKDVRAEEFVRSRDASEGDGDVDVEGRPEQGGEEREQERDSEPEQEQEQETLQELPREEEEEEEEEEEDEGDDDDVDDGVEQEGRPNTYVRKSGGGGGGHISADSGVDLDMAQA
ncbi:MAG: hypothetical protein M1837_000094 [Sclerophora amabilis]|nr:MAG: hypothetical protein M1837_000094 [Sclerophora amabilis]